MKGLVLKGIGGFYYVETDEGLIEARGRGILKKEGVKLSVGDVVDISIIDLANKKGIIENIFPRKNVFIRPPIANVDSFFIVFSVSSPKPSLPLIDKFIIMAEMNEAEPIIVINKCDLASPEHLQEMVNVYCNFYKVVTVCGKTGDGIDQLELLAKDKTVALAGPSGVGKSTIVNRLIPDANMQTGEISSKSLRGKHTTRHAELFALKSGGKIFDTPGFTSFDILNATEQELGHYYPEFGEYAEKCAFNNCIHMNEPNCFVKEGVKAGNISKIRYNSYICNLKEILNKSRNEY